MKRRLILCVLVIVALIIAVVIYNDYNSNLPLEKLEKSDKGKLTNSFENGGLGVELNIKESHIGSNPKEISYVVENTGVDSVSFGENYSIEILNGNDWYKIPFKDNIAFTLQTVALGHGGKYEHKIYLSMLKYKLSKGKYRAINNFWSSTSKTTVSLASEFDVY